MTINKNERFYLERISDQNIFIKNLNKTDDETFFTLCSRIAILHAAACR